MCRAVRCKTCGRTTWSGCGQHIASVKARVPAGQWCPGEHAKTGKTGKTDASKSSNNPGFVRRIFGRS